MTAAATRPRTMAMGTQEMLGWYTAPLSLPGVEGTGLAPGNAGSVSLASCGCTFQCDSRQYENATKIPKKAR